MTKLNTKKDEKLRLLERSLGITSNAAKLKPDEDKEVLCAKIEREVDLQFGFMKLFQIIIAVLAIAILLLLLFAVYRLTKGDTIEGILAGAGAIVSGTASVFLKRQRDDARAAYRAALEVLAKYQCK